MPRIAADGDDAGAADAGDDDVVGLADRRQRRLGQRRQVVIGARRPRRFFSFAPCTVTNDGQKPLTQEKSLLQLDWSMVRLRPHSVSSGCTDDAVRLHAAIAAAFADELVDDDALVGIGKRAALAAAALFGRAGLVVDQHRDAGHRPRARVCTASSSSR